MTDWNMSLLLVLFFSDLSFECLSQFTILLMHVSHARVWSSTANHSSAPSYESNISISDSSISMDSTLDKVLKL